MRRALREIENADGVLAIIDLTEAASWQSELEKLLSELPTRILNNAEQASKFGRYDSEKIVVVLNKMDLLTAAPEIPPDFPLSVNCISARLGDGIQDLKSRLVERFAPGLTEEGSFIARTRHVEAISRGLGHLQQGRTHWESLAGELLAEELRLCHESLCEITGEFSSDELLGRIFSSFCIGK